MWKIWPVRQSSCLTHSLFSFSKLLCRWSLWPSNGMWPSLMGGEGATSSVQVCNGLMIMKRKAQLYYVNLPECDMDLNRYFQFVSCRTKISMPSDSFLAQWECVSLVKYQNEIVEVCIYRPCTKNFSCLLMERANRSWTVYWAFHGIRSKYSIHRGHKSSILWHFKPVQAKLCTWKLFLIAHVCFRDMKKDFCYIRQ